MLREEARSGRREGVRTPPRGWELLPPVNRQMVLGVLGVLAGMLARMVAGGECGDAADAERVRDEDPTVAS